MRPSHSGHLAIRQNAGCHDHPSPSRSISRMISSAQRIVSAMALMVAGSRLQDSSQLECWRKL